MQRAPFPLPQDFASQARYAAWGGLGSKNPSYRLRRLALGVGKALSVRRVHEVGGWAGRDGEVPSKGLEGASAQGRLERMGARGALDLGGAFGSSDRSRMRPEIARVRPR